MTEQTTGTDTETENGRGNTDPERKTIINVTTPPKWKVKKQKLAEKAAGKAELTAKKRRPDRRCPDYLNLPTLDEA